MASSLFRREVLGDDGRFEYMPCVMLDIQAELSKVKDTMVWRLKGG
ncbi:hypothetical protein [Teredinibacter haidensis]|nr:hypothetical protein [Teredinibacter haidensis]